MQVQNPDAPSLRVDRINVKRQRSHVLAAVSILIGLVCTFSCTSRSGSGTAPAGSTAKGPVLTFEYAELDREWLPSQKLESESESRADRRLPPWVRQCMQAGKSVWVEVDSSVRTDLPLKQQFFSAATSVTNKEGGRLRQIVEPSQREVQTVIGMLAGGQSGVANFQFLGGDKLAVRHIEVVSGQLFIVIEHQVASISTEALRVPRRAYCKITDIPADITRIVLDFRYELVDESEREAFIREGRSSLVSSRSSMFDDHVIELRE